MLTTERSHVLTFPRSQFLTPSLSHALMFSCYRVRPSIPLNWAAITPAGPCSSGPGVLLYTALYGMFDLRVSGQYLTGWLATWAWTWTVEGSQVTVE
jgi:hypothetical protein